MSFWTLLKETYKGTKHVMSEVSNGVENLNNELMAFNQEQEIIRPIKDLRHNYTIGGYKIKELRMCIPEEYNNSHHLLNTFDSVLEIIGVVFDYGIENRNGCRSAVLELVKELQNCGEKDNLLLSSNPNSMIDLFLDEYPIELLEKRGYQPPKTGDYYTEDRLKIDRLKFVYTIYGQSIERKASSVNINFADAIKKMTTFKTGFCQKYNL